MSRDLDKYATGRAWSDWLTAPYWKLYDRWTMWRFRKWVERTFQQPFDEWRQTMLGVWNMPPPPTLKDLAERMGGPEGEALKAALRRQGRPDC